MIHKLITAAAPPHNGDIASTMWSYHIQSFFGAHHYFDVVVSRANIFERFETSMSSVDNKSNKLYIYGPN